MPDSPLRKAGPPPPSGRTPRVSGKVDPPDAPERIESTEPDDDLEQYRVPAEPSVDVEENAPAELRDEPVSVRDSDLTGHLIKSNMIVEPEPSPKTVSAPEGIAPAGPQVTSADHELVLKLQRELDEALARIRGTAANVDTWSTGPAPRDPQPGETVLIHVRKDGFTANGRVWYQGQELEFIVGEQNWRDTCDRYGKSWTLLTDAEQIRRYGEVQFGFGPWPGEPFEHPRAAEAEQRRGRKAPTITQLTSESSVRK